MPLGLSQYLAAVQASMQAPPAEAPMEMPADTVTANGAQFSQDAPIAPAYQSPAGSLAAPVDPTPPPAPQSKYLPSDAFAPSNPVEAGVKLAQSRGDLPPDAPPPHGAAPQAGATQAEDPSHGFPLQSVGGPGVIPAHEVDLRGPSLKGAQGSYNDAVAGAIDASTAAHGMGAGREYALALEQERAAQERQQAAEQAQAEREEEMMQKQHDFMQSAKALGQFAFKPDGGFWESRTTGQKIAGMFSLALNGFMAGVGRPVPDQVTMGIERSIRAQENAYHALKDTAQAQQTAFGMAVQKYGNLDAARSMVRAAALDGLQAQAAQVMALNKGTDLGARAAAAYADLEGQKMQQIAQGIRFLPTQVTGRRFVDPRTGLVYTEQEAKAMQAKLDEQQFKREEKGIDVAGQVVVEDAKGRNQQDKDLRAELVTLPNGEMIRAPSTAEATELRKLSQAVNNAQKLVNEAREIRSDASWTVSPSKTRRLKQIEAELTLAFKDRGGLGALSGPDMELAGRGTANLTSLLPIESDLEGFSKHTSNALRSRVATIPGAPSAAKGEMPASFTQHGKK